MVQHRIQADFPKVQSSSVHTEWTRKTSLKIMNSLPAATAFATINPTASILNKPRWTLPGSFNDPLACIFFCGFFSFIQDNSLYSWNIKWSSFLLLYFHPYQSSFFFDLCVTIATKDVFLLQVSTLRTNIYVPLKWQWKAGNFVIWTAAKKETGNDYK